MKTIVILNPKSGKGAAEKLWVQIEAELERGKLEFEMVRTSAACAAIHIAEEAKRDGYENVIAVGGDGTLNEVANGLMRAACDGIGGTLGMVPVGSGNDFITSVGTPKWHEAIQRILSGQTRMVDIGRITADQPAPGYDSPVRYFLNSVDTGFGAQTAEHAHDVPFLQGMPLYLAAIIKTLVAYSVPRLTLQFDHQRIEQPSSILVAANGRQFGGGFLIAPTASIEDGLLDVILAKGLGRLEILSFLPRVMRGTHIGDPRVRFLQTARLVIDSPDPLIVEADGEIPFVAAHHLDIEILPKRLRIMG